MQGQRHYLDILPLEVTYLNSLSLLECKVKFLRRIFSLLVDFVLGLEYGKGAIKMRILYIRRVFSLP